MHGFDVFIKGEIQGYIDTLNTLRKVTPKLKNPLYKKLDNPLAKLRFTYKTSQSNSTKYKLLRKIKQLQHTKMKIRSQDPKRVFYRMHYVRYADDWIILTNTPTYICDIIKQKIATWLLEERQATLSGEKTIIIDLRKT